MKLKNKGMDVSVSFKKSSPYGAVKETYHNVTEVHFNYRSFSEEKRVAFESDIHGTGITQPVSFIETFVVEPATKISRGF